jgi:hypothetical protein
MTDPVDPAEDAGRVRRLRRRATDARSTESSGPGETLPVLRERSERVEIAPENDRRRGGFAGFAAHLLGQNGQKRGLRGGVETLYKAKTSYMGVEWSGPSNRRTPKGAREDTDV